MPQFSAQRALFGAAGNTGTRIKVTLGSHDYGTWINYGYDDGSGSAFPHGSVNPTTANGVAIRYAYYADGAIDLFGIAFTGNLARDFFTSVRPEGGNLLLPNTSELFQYNSTNNYTSWRWGGQGPVPWGASGTKTLVISF